MTQSVPSSTALATSVASARVGRGFLIMLSSICVAVITGLPACTPRVNLCGTILDRENNVRPTDARSGTVYAVCFMHSSVCLAAMAGLHACTHNTTCRSGEAGSGLRDQALRHLRGRDPWAPRLRTVPGPEALEPALQRLRDHVHRRVRLHTGPGPHSMERPGSGVCDPATHAHCRPRRALGGARLRILCPRAHPLSREDVAV